jgi:nicotinate-nucleotide pyrophosphorylase (carboxylating)
MHSLAHLIDLALGEDVGPGDITTENTVDPDRTGTGEIVAKADLVVAGLDVARRVFERVDPRVAYRPRAADGDRIQKGAPVARVEGPLVALLTAERTALNFLQRLSGIATLTREYVETLGGRNVRLVDTRKTTPGWRTLEKYAVRIGGAHNHRMGLYDGVLIKDNHIAACGGVAEAIDRVRGNVSHLVRIEVEVSDRAGVEAALSAGADVIMLDNMDLEGIRSAVALISGRALVEVSGNVTRSDLIRLAETGVDLISVGALTHSAVSVDLSMRIEAAGPRP